jgi:thiamine pyrophosphate-dependent acetolactate synthase large subunit-like protein
MGAYRAQSSHPAVRRALQDADLVLGVGVRPGTEAARTLHADAAGRLLLLDSADRPAPPWPHLAGVPALAATLRALAEGVPARGTPPEVIETCRQARLAQARGLELELARHAGTRPWHVGLALAALDERLTPEIVVTSDVSNVKLWAPLQLRAFGPHSHVQAGSWGTMGYALPAAIGAALALPGHKVVALAGDASFLMSSSDLVTLAQLRLPVVIAVHHDGRIGMIEYMQTAAGRAPYATEIGDVDYARYAEAAGIPARRVDAPAELGAAWDEALAAGGPFLIELMAGHAFPRPSLPRLVEQGLR